MMKKHLLSKGGKQTLLFFHKNEKKYHVLSKQKDNCQQIKRKLIFSANNIFM